jgi:hypothetical protein
MSTIGIMYTKHVELLPLHPLKTRYYLWAEWAGVGRYILSNFVEEYICMDRRSNACIGFNGILYMKLILKSI